MQKTFILNVGQQAKLPYNKAAFNISQILQRHREFLILAVKENMKIVGN